MNHPRTPEDVHVRCAKDDEFYDSQYDTASPQEERLALQLCQIASLLQHERLEVMSGMADVQHNAAIGVVSVKVEFMLRHTDAQDLIDLGTWEPDEESFMVKVMTRRDAKREHRQQQMSRNWIMVLVFLLFNTCLIIAKLTGVA